MAGFNSVADLKPFKTMWRVKVSIVRLWKQYSAAGGLTIEMVIIDSNGDKIHATVKKELVNQFDHQLEQGKTLTLTNFSLNHSVGSYRTTNHLYKISLLATTRVRSCEALPVGLNGFTPVNFQEVLDGSLNPDFLIDVIGHVVEVSHVEMIHVNGKETQKISLELRDLADVRLPMVLWGNFADQVTNAIQLRGEGRLILVLRFGKIKVWKEDRSVSNAYNVSDVQLNPNMAEVEAFRAMLPADELQLAIVEPKPLTLASGVSVKDDFFIHTPRKTIAEMIECRQVEKCIVMCTISAIETDMGWYYLSCKPCDKKVMYMPPLVAGDHEDDDLQKFKLYCPKCKSYEPKLLPRYKLHLVVLDHTGNSKFLLFDHLALQLVNQPCIELTGPITDEVQDPDVLPLALQNLIGKTYLFKVEIMRENFVYKHDTFKVNKIITNLAIINEFDTPKAPKVIQKRWNLDKAALDTEKGWYYLSCNVCGVEVHNVSNDWSSRGAAHCNRLKNYYCEKCKTHIQKPDARYALNLVVLDSTGDTNFLLFENVAEQLIGQPCSALIGGNIDEIQGRALPAVLTERVGKTTIFKITTQYKRSRCNHATFKVLKLITSTDCINELAINHYPMRIRSSSCQAIPGKWSTEQVIGLFQQEAYNTFIKGSTSKLCGSYNHLMSSYLSQAKRRVSHLCFDETESLEMNVWTKGSCSVRKKKEKTDRSG